MLEGNKRWALCSSDGVVLTRNLNEIIRAIETRKPILVRQHFNDVVVSEQTVSLRIYFMIKSIDPIEAHALDLVQGEFYAYTATHSPKIQDWDT